MTKALNIVELEDIFMQPRMICTKLYPLTTCFYKQVVAIHPVKSGRKDLYQIPFMRESPLCNQGGEPFPLCCLLSGTSFPIAHNQT